MMILGFVQGLCQLIHFIWFGGLVEFVDYTDT